MIRRVKWRFWSRSERHEFDSPARSIVEMFTDMARATGTTIGRTEALSVPAVRRGRNMICSIASMPLVEVGPDNAVEPSPLLRQIDLDVPNVVTIAQTVEDLLFDGIGWWLVTAKDYHRFPVAARHLDPGSVSLKPPTNGGRDPLPSGTDPRGGVVWVNGQPVGSDRIIRFDSPNPAVLKHAGREIRRAVMLDQAAAMYAEDPRPLDYFEPSDGADEADDDDVREILNQWVAARRRRSTAYVPAAMKYHTVDTPAPRDLQLVELQRQVSLDIANALGIDPEDLGISTTSRTYSNDVDRRRNRLNDVLSPYMRAITDRLSMGDVTRRGYSVRFDTREYLQPNPTDRWGVYSTAKGMGAMTIDEIRAAEGMTPLVGSAAPEPGRGTPPTPEQSDTPEADTVDASAVPTHTFDGPVMFTADIPVVEFSVDRDNRIIEGLALPYGAEGSKDGVRFSFDEGSLQWDADNPGRVKLMFPRHGMAVGKAVQLSSTPQGLLTRFKVGRGAEGDRALEAAEDGVFDGLSVGVDFDVRSDTQSDRSGVMRVRRADLRHVALTDEPVFDNARVTRVAASRSEGRGRMADTTDAVESAEGATDDTQTTAPVVEAPAVATFSADEVRAMLDRVTATEGPTRVDPTRQTFDSRSTIDFVIEPCPYQFDRRGNFVLGQEHVFSADLHDMALANDVYGQTTEAGRRVMGLLRATFDISSGDVNELNPTIQRPDMYVDQREYRTPLWDFINKGAPPNGINPFMFPKLSGVTGLVNDHVEGVEPTPGHVESTGQTVTPTALSGKVVITREVWDMGGNPAVSNLIWNAMVRSWREGLESASATFLNTLTAATDIDLGAGVEDEALAAAWDAELAELQFARGYDFEAFAIEKALYKRFVAAVDTTGRKLYPIIGPTNANGTARARFQTLDLGGVVGVPSWALPSTPGSDNNSWLFDPTTVWGWATAPQRLEFPGSGPDNTYTPVATVDLAIWGYKAFANTDIGGVRQVIYDTTS